jgi:hypothetical protein
VYRGGGTAQKSNGGVSDGLFAPPQNTQLQPTAPPPTDGNSNPTAPKEDYPTDEELIAYIDKRLRAQAEGGITLEESLDFLNRFLLQFEEEMWQVGLKKSYWYIQKRVIDLQNAIEALGYGELAPDKDPRLCPPTR